MSVAVTGFAHVNLNCSQLSRSKPFYVQALGLRALVHTNPAPQDCAAFGLRQPGQWDAWMLAHGEPGSGIAVDLLEWLRPRPLPAPAHAALGLDFLGFDVPDLEAARVRIEPAGGRIGAALEGGMPPGAMRPGFFASDPDGQKLWVQQGERSRIGFVSVACTQLERCLAFYGEVLGLKAVSAGGPHAVLALPGDASGFRVVLARSPHPAPAPARVEPHRLGLFRMALLSTDIARDHAELRGLGVPGLSEVADLDLGPACPAPRCRALFFRDPDGACLELIEVPAQAASATPPPARA